MKLTPLSAVLSIGERTSESLTSPTRARARLGRLPKSAEVRGRFWQARASGATLKEAAAAAGVSKTAGHYWLHESGGVRPRPTRSRPALRLSLAEREEISRGLAKGLTRTAIARQIGRSPSTVSREVKRNTSVAGYRAVKADRLAHACRAQLGLAGLVYSSAELQVIADEMNNLPRPSNRWSSDWPSGGHPLESTPGPPLTVMERGLWPDARQEKEG